MNKKTEEEERKKQEQEKDADSALKSQVSLPIEDERPAPTYKVGCHRENIKSILCHNILSFVKIPIALFTTAEHVMLNQVIKE